MDCPPGPKKVASVTGGSTVSLSVSYLGRQLFDLNNNEPSEGKELLLSEVCLLV